MNQPFLIGNMDPHHNRDNRELSEDGDIHQTPSSDVRDLANRVAHFLYVSGYLDAHDDGDTCVLTLTSRGGDRIEQVGSGVFKGLVDSLDEFYPRWRQLCPEYRRERHA